MILEIRYEEVDRSLILIPSRGESAVISEALGEDAPIPLEGRLDQADGYGPSSISLRRLGALR